MNKRTAFILPVVILGVLLLAAALIKRNPPQNGRRPPQAGPQLSVETMTVERRNYPVRLESYGTVQPRTRSVLVAQVSGQIISVSPGLRGGGFFETGDVLATIDPRDYEADLRIAEATLMDARQTLAEAAARTEQARTDWQRLGNSGDAPDLVLRLPQLEAARARVSSAQANLDKKRLDLERTQIVAPFAGRILRKFVDVGQVVSPNTQLAEIFASDVVEVRLPLRNADLSFIDLPEAWRFDNPAATDHQPVSIRSDLGGSSVWEAALVRTEGAIDESARQLHVIAQIDDPFGAAQSGRPPLKIGQYVNALLIGKTIEDAIVIPNGTIYQGSYTYIVVDGLLQRRDVRIGWQNDSEAVIEAGLEAGDVLVTTPLGQVTSGVRVATDGEVRGGRRAARDAPGETAGQQTP